MRLAFRDHEFALPDDAIVGHYCAELDVRDAYWEVEEGQVVVDVGASWGRYTLPALACGATVHAVEPDAVALNVLRTCASLNGFDFPQLNVFQMAMYDGGPYPHELIEAIAKSAQRGMEPADDADWWSLDEMTESLDQMLDPEGLPRLDWIKIDVEGGELGVLQGGLETLRVYRPQLLIEDHTRAYHWCAANGTRASILALLANLDYEVEFVPYHGQNDYLIGRPR
jgi:FkbM family methyltransferase